MTAEDSKRRTDAPNIEEREIEGHSVWVATDETGVVAMADDQDELRRLLAENAPAPDDGAGET